MTVSSASTSVPPAFMPAYVSQQAAISTLDKAIDIYSTVMSQLYASAMVIPSYNAQGQPVAAQPLTGTTVNFKA